MKKTAFLLPFLLSAYAQSQIDALSISSMSYQGQSDAQGNQWGQLTIAVRIPPGPSMQGAPFSGQQERKSEQLLPDGGRVTQPTPQPTQVARDAHGRTRVERALTSSFALPGRPARAQLMMVTINDVVEGYYYVLDPSKKVAYRIKYTPVPLRPISSNQPTLPIAVTQPSPIPGGNPQVPTLSIENLGTKMIQGVQAEGRRQTQVFPVGSRGNDRPMTDVNEIWTVPSLQLAVLSTTKSASSTSSMEITNLSTINPTPDLFRPPPGYEVRDQPASFTVEFGNRPVGNSPLDTPR